MLVLLQGPAGSGKSQVAAEMLDGGEVEVLADASRLWVALSGVERGADGRYPVREDDDPALGTARYLQAVAVRHGLEGGADVAVTTSRRGQETRWQRLADDAETEFIVREIDPGKDVVAARLAEPDGELSEPCARAIRRWYR